MHHIARGILVFLFTISIGFAQTTEKHKPSPAIHIINPTYDFGEVPRGEVIRHQFTVRNEGTVPLEIKKIQPD